MCEWFCFLTHVPCVGTLKERQQQLLPSSRGTLDVTSKVPSPLCQAEARQHKRNKAVASDVSLGCSCGPWAGAGRFFCVRS